MDGLTKKYKRSNITFIVNANKIAVITELQAFILSPRHYCYRYRIDKITTQIQKGKIRNLVDLIDSCGPEIEVISTREAYIIKPKVV